MVQLQEGGDRFRVALRHMFHLTSMSVAGIYPRFLLHICCLILRIPTRIYCAAPIYGKFVPEEFHNKYNET